MSKATPTPEADPTAPPAQGMTRLVFVAEEGSHDELTNRNQIYAELHRIQARATPAA